MIFFNLGISYQVPITNEKIEVSIVNNTWVVYNISINYKEYNKNKISYAFLGEVRKIEHASLNNIPVECYIKRLNIGNEILCDIPSHITTKNTTFNLIFLSSKSIKPAGKIYEFAFSKPILDFTENLEIKVILPQKAFIAENQIGSSINPTNFRLSVDPSGRRIIVEWKIKKPKLGEKIDFSVLFEIPKQEQIIITEKRSYVFLYVIVAALILFASIAAYLILLYRKNQEKKIISVLKDDEKLVLEVIRELGNGCKHKDIVKKTKFSKAKVSRILLELQKRGLIKLERVGKNTRIYID